METETYEAPAARLHDSEQRAFRDALLTLAERFVNAHEQLAAAATEMAFAAQREASVIPDLRTEAARWMYRLAPSALDAKPRMPESVKDARSRVAILALGLGERLELWALPEDERKARIEAEKAARAAREAAEGSEHVGDLQGGPF